MERINKNEKIIKENESINELLDIAENNVFEIFDNFQKYVKTRHNEFLTTKQSIENGINNTENIYCKDVSNANESSERLDRIFYLIDDLNKNLEESINSIFNEPTDLKQVKRKFDEIIKK